MPLALVAAALLVGGARAAEVIQDPPLPPTRPVEEAAQAPAAPAADMPLPPERPPELAAPAIAPEPAGPPMPPTAAPLPEPVPEPPPRPVDIATPEPPPAEPDDTECRARLGVLGVAFTPHEPVADGYCGAQRPLRVTALPGGLALSAPVVARCPVAEALGHWTEGLRKASAKHLNVQPKRLLIGGSYECRGRNHDPSAKLSEHAYANAVDVMGFAFEGRADLPVLGAKEGTPEAAFLAEARAAACTAFATVLGPGSDAEHANHFHLDLRERRNGFRLCQ